MTVRKCMLLPSAALALAVTAMPVVADNNATGAPRCDAFRQRLVEAPQLLQLSLPAVKLRREPAYGDEEDVWTSHVALKGQDEFTVEMRCHNGRFDYASADLTIKPENAFDLSGVHPNFDVFAMLYYAFTGTPASQVVGAANEMMKEQPSLNDLSSRDPEYKFPKSDFSALISATTVVIEEFVN
jgi:hypothetical protein